MAPSSSLKSSSLPVKYQQASSCSGPPDTSQVYLHQIFKHIQLVHTIESQKYTPTRHPPAQPAPDHPPESHPSSFLYCRGTAISTHPPLPVYSAIVSSNGASALVVGSLCTLSWRAERGCSTKTGCRQYQVSYAARASRMFLRELERHAVARERGLG